MSRIETRLAVATCVRFITLQASTGIVEGMKSISDAFGNTLYYITFTNINNNPKDIKIFSRHLNNPTVKY